MAIRDFILTPDIRAGITYAEACNYFLKFDNGGIVPINPPHMHDVISTSGGLMLVPSMRLITPPAPNINLNAVPQKTGRGLVKYNLFPTKKRRR